MLGLGLGIFLVVVSPKVSDFFEGNSTSKTLTKFDDHQTSSLLGHINFLDGLTESVRLFWGKFLHCLWITFKTLALYVKPGSRLFCKLFCLVYIKVLHHHYLAVLYSFLQSCVEKIVIFELYFIHVFSNDMGNR